MQIKIRNFSLLSLLAGLLVFSSCTKEDNAIFGDKANEATISNLQGTTDNGELVIDIHEFTTQSVKTELVMRINGQTMVTDAYAAYCNNGTDEFLAVSNKEILLDTTINAQDFEENDFLFLHAATDGEVTSAFGGATFGESVTGWAGLQIIFTDVDVSIESADADNVIGSMTGEFQSLNPETGEWTPLPFSVAFAADVVPNAVLCW